MPVDPHSVGLLDSRGAPSRRNTLERQESLTCAYVRPQTHISLPCGFATTEIRVAPQRRLRFPGPGNKQLLLETDLPSCKNLNNRRVLGNLSNGQDASGAIGQYEYDSQRLR